MRAAAGRGARAGWSSHAWEKAPGAEVGQRRAKLPGAGSCAARARRCGNTSPAHARSRAALSIAPLIPAADMAAPAPSSPFAAANQAAEEQKGVSFSPDTVEQPSTGEQKGTTTMSPSKSFKLVASPRCEGAGGAAATSPSRGPAHGWQGVPTAQLCLHQSTSQLQRVPPGAARRARGRPAAVVGAGRRSALARRPARSSRGCSCCRRAPTVPPGLPLPLSSPAAARTCLWRPPRSTTPWRPTGR